MYYVPAKKWYADEPIFRLCRDRCVPRPFLGRTPTKAVCSLGVLLCGKMDGKVCIVDRGGQDDHLCARPIHEQPEILFAYADRLEARGMACPFLGTHPAGTMRGRLGRSSWKGSRRQMIQQQITHIRTVVALWRVLGLIVLCQASGALLGLVPLLQTRWGLDLWLGMAAGTLVGFLLGTAWHLGAPRTVRGLSGLLIVSTLLALVLVSVSADKQNWARMAQLQHGNLRAIVAVNQSGKQQLVRLEEPAVLAAFAKGIAAAVSHMPNHPDYSDSWFVVVEGTQTYQFELHLNTQFPQRVIGRLVKRSGNVTSDQLTFRSDGLRPWVDEYLIQAAGARAGSGR